MGELNSGERSAFAPHLNGCETTPKSTSFLNAGTRYVSIYLTYSFQRAMTSVFSSSNPAVSGVMKRLTMI